MTCFQTHVTIGPDNSSVSFVEQHQCISLLYTVKNGNYRFALIALQRNAKPEGSYCGLQRQAHA